MMYHNYGLTLTTLNVDMIITFNTTTLYMMVPNCDKFPRSPGYHPLGVEEIFLAAFLTPFAVVKRHLYTPVNVKFFGFQT